MTENPQPEDEEQKTSDGVIAGTETPDENTVAAGTGGNGNNGGENNGPEKFAVKDYLSDSSRAFKWPEGFSMDTPGMLSANVNVSPSDINRLFKDCIEPNLSYLCMKGMWPITAFNMNSTEKNPDGKTVYAPQEVTKELIDNINRLGCVQYLEVRGAFGKNGEANIHIATEDTGNALSGFSHLQQIHSVGGAPKITYKDKGGMTRNGLDFLHGQSVSIGSFSSGQVDIQSDTFTGIDTGSIIINAEQGVVVNAEANAFAVRSGDMSEDSSLEDRRKSIKAAEAPLPETHSFTKVGNFKDLFRNSTTAEELAEGLNALGDGANRFMMDYAIDMMGRVAGISPEEKGSISVKDFSERFMRAKHAPLIRDFDKKSLLDVLKQPAALVAIASDINSGLNDVDERLNSKIADTVDKLYEKIGDSTFSKKELDVILDRDMEHLFQICGVYEKIINGTSEGIRNGIDKLPSQIQSHTKVLYDAKTKTESTPIFVGFAAMATNEEVHTNATKRMEDAKRKDSRSFEESYHQHSEPFDFGGNTYQDEKPAVVNKLQELDSIISPIMKDVHEEHVRSYSSAGNENYRSTVDMRREGIADNVGGMFFVSKGMNLGDYALLGRKERFVGKGGSRFMKIVDRGSDLLSEINHSLDMVNHKKAETLKELDELTSVVSEKVDEYEKSLITKPVESKMASYVKTLDPKLPEAQRQDLITKQQKKVVKDARDEVRNRVEKKRMHLCRTLKSPAGRTVDILKEDYNRYESTSVQVKNLTGEYNIKKMSKDYIDCSTDVDNLIAEASNMTDFSNKELFANLNKMMNMPKEGRRMFIDSKTSRLNDIEKPRALEYYDLLDDLADKYQTKLDLEDNICKAFGNITNNLDTEFMPRDSSGNDLITDPGEREAYIKSISEMRACAPTTPDEKFFLPALLKQHVVTIDKLIENANVLSVARNGELGYGFAGSSSVECVIQDTQKQAQAYYEKKRDNTVALMSNISNKLTTLQSKLAISGAEPEQIADYQKIYEPAFEAILNDGSMQSVSRNSFRILMNQTKSLCAEYNKLDDWMNKNRTFDDFSMRADIDGQNMKASEDHILETLADPNITPDEYDRKRNQLNELKEKQAKYLEDHKEGRSMSWGDGIENTACTVFNVSTNERGQAASFANSKAAKMESLTDGQGGVFRVSGEKMNNEVDIAEMRAAETEKAIKDFGKSYLLNFRNLMLMESLMWMLAALLKGAWKIGKMAMFSFNVRKWKNTMFRNTSRVAATSLFMPSPNGELPVLIKASVQPETGSGVYKFSSPEMERYANAHGITLSRDGKSISVDRASVANGRAHGIDYFNCDKMVNGNYAKLNKKSSDAQARLEVVRDNKMAKYASSLKLVAEKKHLSNATIDAMLDKKSRVTDYALGLKPSPVKKTVSVDRGQSK